MRKNPTEKWNLGYILIRMKGKIGKTQAISRQEMRLTVGDFHTLALKSLQIVPLSFYQSKRKFLSIKNQVGQFPQVR